MAKDEELAMKLQNMGPGVQDFTPPPYEKAPTAPPPSFHPPTATHIPSAPSYQASEPSVPSYLPPKSPSVSSPSTSGYDVPPSYDALPTYGSNEGSTPLPTYDASQNSNAYNSSLNSYDSAPPSYGAPGIASSATLDVENERLRALDKFDNRSM